MAFVAYLPGSCRYLPGRHWLGEADQGGVQSSAHSNRNGQAGKESELPSALRDSGADYQARQRRRRTVQSHQRRGSDRNQGLAVLAYDQSCLGTFRRKRWRRGRRRRSLSSTAVRSDAAIGFVGHRRIADGPVRLIERHGLPRQRRQLRQPISKSLAVMHVRRPPRVGNRPARQGFVQFRNLLRQAATPNFRPSNALTLAYLPPAHDRCQRRHDGSHCPEQIMACSIPPADPTDVVSAGYPDWGTRLWPQLPPRLHPRPPERSHRWLRQQACRSQRH